MEATFNLLVAVIFSCVNDGFGVCEGPLDASGRVSGGESPIYWPQNLVLYTPTGNIFTEKIDLQWDSIRRATSYTPFLASGDGQGWKPYESITDRNGVAYHSPIKKTLSVVAPGRYAAYIEANTLDGDIIRSNRVDFDVSMRILPPTIDETMNGQKYLVGEIIIPFQAVRGFNQYVLYFEKNNAKYAQHPVQVRDERPTSAVVKIAHPGHYFVYVRADERWYKSDWSRPVHIDVEERPTIFVPRKAFFPGSISFSWQNFVNVYGGYNLRIYKKNEEGAFMPVEGGKRGKATEQVLNIPDPGLYQAKVTARARGISSLILDFVVVSNWKTRITAPDESHDGLLIYEVEFQWEEVDDAPAYRLEIEGPIISDDDESLNSGKRLYAYETSATSQAVHTIRSRGRYRVRVATLLDGGRLGEWSDVKRFHFDGIDDPTYEPDKDPFVPFDFHPVGESWMKEKCNEFGLKLASVRPDSSTITKLTSREPPSTYPVIRGAGDCFFHTLSHEIANTQLYYKNMRRRVCNEIEKNPRKYLRPEVYLIDDEVAAYVNKMRNETEWATFDEIEAAAHLLKTQIWLYAKADSFRHVWRRFGPDSPDPRGAIHIWLVHDNHYAPIFKWDPVF